MSVRNLPSFSKMPEKPTCRSLNASATDVFLAILFKIKHLAKPGIVDARRIIQSEIVRKPGIVAAENFAELVEDEAPFDLNV